MNLCLLPTSSVTRASQMFSYEAILYVYKSGDFLVLPAGFKFVADSQVVYAKKEKIAFNFKWCRLSQIPFSKHFCFLSVLFAWLFRKCWRLSPLRATILRDTLTRNGFSLLYVKDDTYRVSLFRHSRFRLRFYRKLPVASFVQASYVKLNHVTFTGLDIYFNGKN